VSGPATPDHDIVIVGAGFSGIYLFHKLRDTGLDVLLVDAVTPRFLLPALGFASKPYVPDIPGLDTFSGDWICDFLIWLRDNDIERFESDPDAEAGWTEMGAQVGTMTLFPEADSWYMGANIPEKNGNSSTSPAWPAMPPNATT